MHDTIILAAALRSDLLVHIFIRVLFAALIIASIVYFTNK